MGTECDKVLLFNLFSQIAPHCSSPSKKNHAAQSIKHMQRFRLM